jgi:hypothetical protein
LFLIRVRGIILLKLEIKMFRKLALRFVKTEHLVLALYELNLDRSRDRKKVARKLKAELLLARELLRRGVKFWA